MKTKLSSRFWLSLALFGLMGQVAWVIENMQLNVFIYKMFAATPDDISTMVAASAVSATLTTLFIGALSDRVGKRKLFICGGYILWGISIFAFGLLRVEWLESLFPAASGAALGITLTIILDCVMTFFGSSANDAAYNAWLTDSTDESNRGSAEGINAMMPLVAILVVFGALMFFDLDKSKSWTVIFFIIGAATIIIGIIGIFIINEKPLAPSKTKFLSNLIYGFRPSTVKANPSLYFYLIAFIIFNIAIQIFMPYLIIYYEVSLGMTDYVFIMAPAIVLASVVTAFWGRVYDKKGFTFSSRFSLLWLAAGFVILFFFRATLPVFIGSLLMMCGYLAGMAVFGAKIRDLTPEGKSGRLQGVRIFSQVLVPGVIGPKIGSMILANAEKRINISDGTEYFVPNANIFLASLVPTVILAIVLIICDITKKPSLNKDLKTPFEEDKEGAWNIHPDPMMKRDNYLSLCGEWDLSVKSKKGVNPLGSITVPYPPESRISGVERELKKSEKYLYGKKFMLSDEMSKDRIILHFGAVDQIATVTLNGKYLGEHIGGYLPFEFDITDAVESGENTLTVEVTDDLDHNYGWGKQRRDRGGMWYTPISGIWQSVWLESVPENYIKSFRITPSLTGVTIEIEGGEDEKKLTLKESGKKYVFSGNKAFIEVENPQTWTPEHPYLYEFTLESGSDKIESYFALRTVSIEDKNGKKYICLNGKPYFFHGLLDQGYFSDGIYTPATPEALKNDVLRMKECGFNMLRKHIKIEHKLFYYYCDKHGMAVFQDMVNSGDYSFIADTVLPTAGLRKGFTRKANSRRREAFEKDSENTVSILCNHPSVVYYTIFNEGWGQFDADGQYERLKALDGTRIWDATSGWFTAKKSDVQSEHIYFKKLDMKCDGSKPLVLSEFGGYSCKIEDRSFNLDKTYGYKFFADAEKFEEALEKLYVDEVIPMIDRGLCASVYTQVSDVEDETNGLLTYDRQILKVDKERMKRISDAVISAFESTL
jgi:MFS family permease